MICDDCSAQKATVHLTEIVNGQVTKLNLCEYCAEKRGSDMEKHFGIANLLQGLTELPSSQSATVKRAKCKNCGISFDEFKKIGRLGCSECYQEFREHLAPLLKRIHGSNTHIGKSLDAGVKKAVKAKAKAKNTKKELLESIDLLQKKLKKAVTSEAYEDAAQIRDEIRKLEERIKKV